MIMIIRNWIVSVVTAVIFMVLVDMILPSNSLKKYAKIITGLIVIVTILTPVFKLFDRNVNVETYVAQYTEEFNKKTSEVGKIELENKVENQTMEVFRQNLAAAIEKELYSSTGKRYTVESISINEDKDSLEYTMITSIQLKKSEESGQIKPVEKIVISKQQEVQEAPKDEKAVNVLKEKFNVNPAVVKFIK